MVIVNIYLTNYVLLSVVKIVSHFKKSPHCVNNNAHDSEILIVGMLHDIVLHMLHDRIFVDFLGLTGGMKHCHIKYKVSLLWRISYSSGYVYFSTKTYSTLNCYGFFFTCRGYGISFHIAISCQLMPC